MKLKFTNILLLLFSLLGCSSCLNEKLGGCPGDEPGGDADNSQYVYLSMSVGVESPAAQASSRAEEVDESNYFEDAATKYERMNTLRVIIVRGKQHNNIIYSPDSSGYVEHNRLFKLTDEGLVKYDNMTFKVHAGEEKKIYFIANEKYVADTKNVNFDDLKPHELYPTDFIEDIILSSTPGMPLIDNDGNDDNSKYYIPMSESFDIDLPLPEHPSDYEVKKEFFITRAAVKFSFNILTPDYPAYDSGLRIKKITVNKIGNIEYFLPRDTKYDPAKYDESSHDNGGRFITDYTLPTNPEPTNTPYVFDTGIKDMVLDCTASNKGVHPFIPYLYFPESYQGKYSVSITIGDENSENDFTYDPAELENLPMLPRNTHALVNIKLKKTDIEATVTLFPYTAVNLNPLFGFIILVESVTISERSQDGELVEIKSKELREGESIDLIGTVKPDNANNQDLVWTSGDPNVVTVSEIGRVTAKDLPEGATEATVSVTAMAADGSGAKATCMLNVKPKIPVEKITVSPSTWEGSIGSTTTLTPTILPTDATVQDIEWTSSDPNVATVSSYGVVTAIGPGTATITASATDRSGSYATCNVIVKDIIPVTSVKLSAGPTGAFYPRQQFSFYATIEPNNATNQELEWKSSNPEVATVSSYGLVTAVKEGDATITATVKNESGMSASQEIHVSKSQVTGIQITRQGKQVTAWTDATPGKELDIRATIIPYDATYKQVTWSSSNENVATIKPGRIDENTDPAKYGTAIVNVVAKSKGTATITVTSVDNPEVSTTYEVTVN